MLVSLMHSPQSNAWQNKHTYSKMACLWSYPWQEQKHSTYGSTTTSLAKLHIMLRICQKYFIAKVEQEWVMLWHSIIAKHCMIGSITTIATKHHYWKSPKYAWISLYHQVYMATKLQQTKTWRNHQVPEIRNITGPTLHACASHHVDHKNTCQAPL